MENIESKYGAKKSLKIRMNLESFPDLFLKNTIKIFLIKNMTPFFKYQKFTDTRGNI